METCCLFLVVIYDVAQWWEGACSSSIVVLLCLLSTLRSMCCLLAHISLSLCLSVCLSLSRSVSPSPSLSLLVSFFLLLFALRPPPQPKSEAEQQALLADRLVIVRELRRMGLLPQTRSQDTAREEKTEKTEEAQKQRTAAISPISVRGNTISAGASINSNDISGELTHVDNDHVLSLLWMSTEPGAGSTAMAGCLGP